MATKGKDKLIKGQITFDFFETEKSKLKNKVKKEKPTNKKVLKPIKSKHFKRSKYGDFKRKSL